MIIHFVLVFSLFALCLSALDLIRSVQQFTNRISASSCQGLCPHTQYPGRLLLEQCVFPSSSPLSTCFREGHGECFELFIPSDCLRKLVSSFTLSIFNKQTGDTRYY
ncbi:hypothetical protein IW261DRAFT_1457191 [Armillaria novae-zelandiae]|uniref:Secreted protein n=1 Tax=Armillaria novae-zelandiae TaxID=153914 RepID=A0AA39UCU9_9AGAR|nr:hypothetical protein IW261DRAFT_1457191 [Armillaria novae-zelandiae]